MNTFTFYGYFPHHISLYQVKPHCRCFLTVLEFKDELKENCLKTLINLFVIFCFLPYIIHTHWPLY